jgi:hypothetical protein
MSGEKDEELERSEVEDLLPWRAAGRLSRRDQERVDAALAKDPELARRFELVREELASTVHLNETLGAPSPKAMDALFAKIDAEPKRMRSPMLDLSERISDFFASLTPRTVAWSAAAAVLVVVLQAGIIGAVVLAPKPGGDHIYQTASGPGAPTTLGQKVLIRFKAEATASKITQFLDANDAKIVGGPAPGGLYTVRIAEKPLPQAKLDEAIAHLGKDKAVEIVLPETANPPIQQSPGR